MITNNIHFGSAQKVLSKKSFIRLGNTQYLKSLSGKKAELPESVIKDLTRDGASIRIGRNSEFNVGKLMNLKASFKALGSLKIKEVGYNASVSIFDMGKKLKSVVVEKVSDRGSVSSMESSRLSVGSVKKGGFVFSHDKSEPCVENLFGVLVSHDESKPSVEFSMPSGKLLSLGDSHPFIQHSVKGNCTIG